MATPEKNTDAVYDASTLGTPKMLVLGLQHLFAMFGATVLVPAITGLNVSTTLLFAGLGTLLFHLITGRKVPAFLGSSFAFLGAYGLVTASGQDIPLTYSCFGVAVAGLVYLVLALKDHSHLLSVYIYIYVFIGYINAIKCYSSTSRHFKQIKAPQKSTFS